MSISFVQKHKQLYGADFLVTHNGSPIAQLSLDGKMGSREGSWSGSVMGHYVTMAPVSGSAGLRPYAVSVDGKHLGTVAQINMWDGIFSRYHYYQLDRGAERFALYCVNLGKTGSAACLHRDGAQLAQIDKEATVRDDLHSFEIFALDEDSAFVSILMCCYRYVQEFYRPGEKTTAAVSTRTSITTNKFLKSKYDPDFKSKNATI